MKIERRLVKFVLPAVGVLGLYAGALLGLWAAARGVSAPSRWLLWPAAALGGALGGVLLMVPVDSKLGEAAAHVDLLRIPVWWAYTTATLLAVELALDRLAGRMLPPSLATTALWCAGVWSIWRDELRAPK